MKRPIGILITLVAIAQIAMLPACVNRQPEAPPVVSADSVSLIFDGSEWAELMCWRFSEGPYPGGWGWGNWEVEDSLLVGEDPDGNISVYFLPFTHGDNVMLEVKAKLVRSVAGQHVEAHVLTRDDDAVHSESGLVLVADTNAVDVRHMVDTDEYIRRRVPIATTTRHDQWYVMRFLMRDGKIDAFVDDERVYPSALVDSGAGAGTQDEETARAFPAAVYHEPHLSIRYGVAAFEHVRIYAIPTEGGVPTTASAATSTRVAAPRRAAPRERHWLVDVLLLFLYAVIFLVCVYVVRHYAFTLNRMFGRQRQPYVDVDSAEWPEVTVIVPAHNEEMVIGEVLEALLDVDYPADKLIVMPVNDRSKDDTAKIIEEFARHHPARVVPFHRRSGKAGKAAALNDAIEHVTTDIVLVFDADYVPGRGLVKQLVAPFFDPEVGAVMGRVVPYNVSSNLLTRLLDLERAGGYQVDQQARMNMKMVPQYGGTVGGVRKRALLAVGGWREDSLAEDTDATFRLLEGGWKTVYQNRSECYEQVPESWHSRIRQIMRWAKGHNQATARYAFSILRNQRMSWMERLDGFLLLGVYLMPPVLLFGWSLGIVLWYLGEPRAGLIAILLVTSYSTVGNFAVFFEIAAATHLDGSRERIRLMPFVFFGFLVSLFSVTRSVFAHVAINGNGNGKNGKNGDVVWHKTERNGTFNGHVNGSNGVNGRKPENGRNGDTVDWDETDRGAP